MLLKGKDVANAINEKTKKQVQLLKENGIIPTVAIFRVGNNENDLAYEKGIDTRCNQVNIQVKKYLFSEDVKPEDFYQELQKANNDSNIHGILVFRPLPSQFKDSEVRNFINPIKDIDGCSDSSLAGVFTNTDLGFAPCTAQAAMEILDYYGIEVKSKNVTVIGRSLVVGKPLSMLLLNKNATVTICHTKTLDLKQKAKQAEILILATGQMESINSEYVSNGQTVIDVGISWNEKKQKLCGDVLFEEVEPLVENITPVPGGVGSVTTSVLISHVAIAALKQNAIQA